MNKINLNKLLDKPTSLSEKFYNKIKIKKFNPSLNYKQWPEEWKKIYYKSYSRFEEIMLPKPKLSSDYLFKVFINRNSNRQFSKKNKITLQQLSNLLYFSGGEKKNSFFKNRFYPSAGQRYPLEIYLLSFNTELKYGLYHYYVPNNSLEKFPYVEKFIFKKYFNQSWIKKAAFIILITAFFKRMTIKYGDRGYNYTLIEAGHLAQNFCLTSSTLNIKCCPVGGFIEDNFNNLLDIDGINESVIYILVFGP